MPKSNRSGQARVLTPEQMECIWSELDQPYRIATQIAYYTAARIGEVLSLTRGDWRDDHLVYRASMTKTKTTRQAAVGRRLGELLRSADLPKDGYLFPSVSASGHLTPRAVDKHMRRAAAMCGVEGASTHSFRRSHATHLHRAGVPLRAIQRITGHKDLASLEKYLDIGSAEAFDMQGKVMDELFGGSDNGSV